MKVLQLVAVLVSGVVLFGCETTQTAGQGNQERKRLAALQQGQTQTDETQQKLQSAQSDIINRGTNPGIRY